MIIEFEDDKEIIAALREVLAHTTGQLAQTTMACAAERIEELGAMSVYKTASHDRCADERYELEARVAVMEGALTAVVNVVGALEGFATDSDSDAMIAARRDLASALDLAKRALAE